MLPHSVLRAGCAMERGLCDCTEMQDPDPRERVAFIVSLFPSEAEAERLMRDEAHLCRMHGESDIHWDQFRMVIGIESSQQVVDDILARADTDHGYVGATTCPMWRFVTCHGHNNMVAHNKRFDYMEVILVEKAEPAQFLEEMLIEYARERGHTLANAERYVPGPIRPRSKLFWYVCTKRKVS